MNMHLLIKTRRPHRRRSGYMLLVCTLAVTVLSMASIAIIRSSQHQIRLVDAQRSTVQGRATADGLYQRAIAVLRDNPNAEGLVVDPAIQTPGVRAELKKLSKDTTIIEVFLYEQAAAPAISRTIDTASLSQGGKGKGGKGNKGKGKNGNNGNGGNAGNGNGNGNNGNGNNGKSK